MQGHIEPNGPNLATASADGSVRLWSLNPDFEEQKSILLPKTHQDIVNCVAFHPMGYHLASGSHDLTWRLWDLESRKELLTQEGHSGPIYCLAFQQDGSLLATCDLHGVGLIWDIRSGKNILQYQAHQKQIIATEWLSNGF